MELNVELRELQSWLNTGFKLELLLVKNLNVLLHSTLSIGTNYNTTVSNAKTISTIQKLNFWRTLHATHIIANKSLRFSVQQSNWFHAHFKSLRPALNFSFSEIWN